MIRFVCLLTIFLYGITSPLLSAPGDIMTIAGGGAIFYAPKVRSATEVYLSDLQGIWVDDNDNVYIAEKWTHKIHMIDPRGNIRTIAGNGAPGYAGDGGPATNARISEPYDIYGDAEGNIYFSDTGNHTVRRIDARGIITTIAGNGKPGFDDAEKIAPNTMLDKPKGLFIDNLGQIFIADSENHRVRKVDPLTSIISTIAGNGKTSGRQDSEDDARDVRLIDPTEVIVNKSGVMFISDHNYLWRVLPNGRAFAGPGGQFRGLLALGDSVIIGQRNRVRESSTGTDLHYIGITRGDPDLSSVVFSVETFGSFERIRDIAFDKNLNIYFTVDEVQHNQSHYPIDYSEFGKAKVKTFKIKVGTGKAIVLTNGFQQQPPPPTGDPGQQPPMVGDGGLIPHPGGPNPPTTDGVDTSDKRIATIAGKDIKSGNIGDGGFADDALLNNPTAVFVDLKNDIYIADTGHHVIRRIDANGFIHTVVGTAGEVGYGGDGDLATKALLHSPTDVILDAEGYMFIADSGNNTIRFVSPDGMINSFTQGQNAVLKRPQGITLDEQGNIWIADRGNGYVRFVDNQNVMNTVAGNEVGPARIKFMQMHFGYNSWPLQIQVIANSVFFIQQFADEYYFNVGAHIYQKDLNTQQIQQIDSRFLRMPSDIIFSDSGHLYAADSGNHRVVMINERLRIDKVVAGIGSDGVREDGTSATMAMLNSPEGLAFDKDGNLYIADTGNNLIRKIEGLAAFSAPGKTAVVLSDFNFDKQINFSDFIAFASHFGQKIGDPQFDSLFDLDGDGEVGFGDFIEFASHFGKVVE